LKVDSFTVDRKLCAPAIPHKLLPDASGVVITRNEGKYNEIP